jgi:hypothetical protein
VLFGHLKIVLRRNRDADQAIQAIGTDLDSLGRREYEYQAHGGAVDTQNTPYVKYAYAADDDGVYTKGLRLISVR